MTPLVSVIIPCFNAAPWLGEAIESVPEIAGVSAGGMPDRVKCLHVLLAHALAAGPGVNPLGDLVRDEVGPWWASGRCRADG